MTSPSDHPIWGDRPTVPCKWCLQPTPMLGTRECDNCHEVAGRLGRMAPELFVKMCALLVEVETLEAALKAAKGEK